MPPVVDHVLVVHCNCRVTQKIPGVMPAGHQYLAFGDANGPGDERPLRVVFGELAKKDHRDVLKQVLRFLEIRDNRVDVAGDNGLGFGPTASELFVVVHDGWSLTLSLPPAANRYMKSVRNAKPGDRVV